MEIRHMVAIQLYGKAVMLTIQPLIICLLLSGCSGKGHLDMVDNQSMVGRSESLAFRCPIPLIIGKKDIPVFSLYTLSPPPIIQSPDDYEDAGIPVNISVYASGRVVWSPNQRGGPPYMVGSLAAEAVRHLISMMDDIVNMTDDHILSTPYFGPSSTHSIMILILPNRSPVEMSSWHEWLERPPASQYEKRFREIWNSLKHLVYKTKPLAGKEDDTIRFRLVESGGKDLVHPESAD